MPIKRAKRTGKFAQIPNETLRDQNLTNSAYRLLMYMLSMSDDWIFRNSKIAKDFGKSERWVRKTLTELERAGYVKRKAIKNKMVKLSIGNELSMIHQRHKKRTLVNVDK